MRVQHRRRMAVLRCSTGTRGEHDVRGPGARRRFRQYCGERPCQQDDSHEGRRDRRGCRPRSRPMTSRRTARSCAHSTRRAKTSRRRADSSIRTAGSCQLKNLAAGTEYTIDVRRVWGNGLEVSEPVQVTFRPSSPSSAVPESVHVLQFLRRPSSRSEVLMPKATKISAMEDKDDHRSGRGGQDPLVDAEDRARMCARAVGDLACGDVVVSHRFIHSPREGTQVMRAGKPRGSSRAGPSEPNRPSGVQCRWRQHYRGM